MRVIFKRGLAPSVERALDGVRPRPLQLKALCHAERLEGLELGLVLAYLVRLQPFLQAVGGEEAGGFADVPFYGVEAVAAVGDVGDTQVLAGRKEIAQAHGKQRAEWNAEGQRIDVDVVVERGRGVEIDAVR